MSKTKLKYMGTAANVWFFPAKALKNIRRWQKFGKGFFNLLRLYDALDEDTRIYKSEANAINALKKEEFTKLEANVWTSERRIALIEPEVSTDKDVWENSL